MGMLSIDLDNKKKLNAEWRFLVRRAMILCDEIDRAALPDSAPGVAPTREIDFQLEAFRERRDRTFSLIEHIREEGSERLPGQLEGLRRLVSGLECSRSFFVSPPSATAAR
jgi:hypothetical protein